jgi:hypothetical protein
MGTRSPVTTGTSDASGVADAPDAPGVADAPDAPGVADAPDAPGAPGAGGGPVVPTGLDETATNRLHRLAADGRTGALQIVGRPGGVVHLAGGRIVYAESPGTPGAEVAVLRAARPDEAAWAVTVASLQTRAGRKAAASHADGVVARGVLSPVRLDAAVQSATADALLASLAGDGVTVVRTRFVAAQRPWVRLSGPLTPAAALAETSRRLRLLAAAGPWVRPDDDVVRAAAPGPVAVRLSAQKWDLVRLCPERRTPRDLAWLVGRGVLATTIEVAELIELGVLRTASPRGRGAARRRRISFLAAAVTTAAAEPEPAGRESS